MLIEKLQEQLEEFDKKAKLNVRLIQRKKRLAYVTVNLSNIIQVHPVVVYYHWTQSSMTLLMMMMVMVMVIVLKHNNVLTSEALMMVVLLGKA